MKTITPFHVRRLRNRHFGTLLEGVLDEIHRDYFAGRLDDARYKKETANAIADHAQAQQKLWKIQSN